MYSNPDSDSQFEKEQKDTDTTTLTPRQRLMNKLRERATKIDRETINLDYTFKDAIVQYISDESPLHQAIFKSPDTLHELLKTEKDDINKEISIKRIAISITPHLKGYTPLHLAARQGKIEHAKILLEAGADINKYKIHKENTIEEKVLLLSPLHTAVRYGQTEFALFLIEQGASLTFSLNGTEYSAIGVATEYKKLETLEALLKEQQNSSKPTAQTTATSVADTLTDPISTIGAAGAAAEAAGSDL